MIVGPTSSELAGVLSAIQVLTLVLDWLAFSTRAFATTVDPIHELRALSHGAGVGAVADLMTLLREWARSRS